MMEKLRWLVLLTGTLVLTLASGQASGQPAFSNSNLSGTYVFHFSGSGGELLNFNVPTLNQAIPFNFSCCGPIPPPSITANFVNIPYSLPVALPAGGAASFVADGSGNITSGSGFFFRQATHSVDFPNIKVSSVQPDGNSAVEYHYGFTGGQIAAPFSVGMAVTISGFQTPGYNGTFVITAFDLNRFIVFNPNPPDVLEESPAVSISGYVIQDHSCNFTLTGTYSVNSDGTGNMNLIPAGPCIQIPNIGFNLLMGRKGEGGVLFSPPIPSQPPGITYSSFFTGSFIKQ